MNVLSFHKNRFVWLILIILISLGLVGVAVAAVSTTSRSVSDVQANPPPNQGGVHSEDSLPPSPFHYSSVQQPVYQPAPDSLLEQTRLQAMAESQSFNFSITEEITRVEFWTNNTNETWIWGNGEPNQPVTITISNGDILTGSTNITGDFGTNGSTFLSPGDIIIAVIGQGNFPVTITFPDEWAGSDSLNQWVTGRTGIPGVREVEIHTWWDGQMITTTTDINGYFTQSMYVQPQGQGNIRFIDNVQPNNVQTIFHRVFYDQEPSYQVNYGHDWVEGQYDPYIPVWITVTNDLGEIRATAHGTTSVIPWWGGSTGFSTGYNVFWDGANPDIQVWDHVYLSINGRTHELQLGEILGEFDYDNDIFTVTFNIPWLTEDVWGDCGVWVENGLGMGFTHPISPTGGTYTCDFGALGWDLQPGQPVGVSYGEPNSNNRVYNVFQDPVPHLYVNQESWGEPASGNNYMLRMHFNNDGWATAPNVVISQTLDGMTYLGDTSGFPHTGTGAPGDPIVWDVGDMPYNHYSETWFDVFVSIDVPPQSIVTSTIDIESNLDYYQDEGSKHFEWTAEVRDNNTFLNIGKNAWTGDPAPGTDFVYAVNTCNNGSTSSSEVVVTDTLPLATTLIDWWGQNPGWEEVSRAEHQLVLKRPTIPGYWCMEIYINVHLSEQAWQGMPLHNEAWVWSSSDLDPWNNYTDFVNYVGSPNYNLHLDPGWVQGQFIPGGEVSFDINFSNWGNMPMPGTLLTATIPLGTEFLSAYGWDWRGGFTFTPTVITDEYVVWDLGEYPNSNSQGVGIRLRIADETLPGAALVVEYRIMGEALEYRYDDNVVVYTETVNDYGTNLRVDKHANWSWHGDGQLGYELRITNIGSQSVYNVAVTDTYPVSTTLSWCWWNHGPGNLQPCEDRPGDHQAIFRLDYMNPGETASANLNVDLLPEYVGVRNLSFVNQVDISNFDDINLADNHDEVTSFTGPDIFIHKWLKAGDLGPGELITYTVEFGNLSKWGTDWRYTIRIIDTLPENTTFVKAIPYWGLQDTLEPESIIGQQVTWTFEPMGGQQTLTFDLVVQIDEDYPLGEPLLNIVEAYGDSPYDTDFDLANNYDEDLQEINPPEAFSKLAPEDMAMDVPIDPTLSWEDSQRAVSYAYCLDTSDDDACDEDWIDLGKATSVDLTELTNDTTYYWQVRAINIGGTTDADGGTWWSFTTIVSPPADFGKTAPTNGAVDVSTSPTLSWEASSGASSYQVCLDMTNDDACDGSWTSTGSNTSIDLTGLSNEVAYYWQVQALNAGGTTDADAGTWWSFTTETGIFNILLPLVQK